MSLTDGYITLWYLHWYNIAWAKSQATHLLKNIQSVKKYFKIRQQTQFYINYSHHCQEGMHSVSFSCFMQPGEEFLQWWVEFTAEYFVSILPLR